MGNRFEAQPNTAKVAIYGPVGDGWYACLMTRGGVMQGGPKRFQTRAAAAIYARTLYPSLPVVSSVFNFIH